MASTKRGSIRDPGGRLEVRTGSFKLKREDLEGKEDRRWRGSESGLGLPRR